MWVWQRSTAALPLTAASAPAQAPPAALAPVLDAARHSMAAVSSSPQAHGGSPLMARPVSTPDSSAAAGKAPSAPASILRFHEDQAALGFDQGFRAVRAPAVLTTQDYRQLLLTHPNSTAPGPAAAKGKASGNTATQKSAALGSAKEQPTDSSCMRHVHHTGCSNTTIQQNDWADHVFDVMSASTKDKHHDSSCMGCVCDMPISTTPDLSAGEHIFGMCPLQNSTSATSAPLTADMPSNPGSQTAGRATTNQSGGCQ